MELLEKFFVTSPFATSHGVTRGQTSKREVMQQIRLIGCLDRETDELDSVKAKER